MSLRGFEAYLCMDKPRILTTKMRVLIMLYELMA